MAKKIIVAVHGMGEQLRGETIRSVAYQVCRFWGVPASMPLGRFGAELVPDSAAPSGTIALDSGQSGAGTWSMVPPKPPAASFVMMSPPDPSLAKYAGPVILGEVYWADIPRGPAAQRYTLEEAKKWALAVVERVRDLDEESSQPRSSRDYQFARIVIGQLVEGIGVLGRLCFLGEKAGLPPFKLDDLLVNYLGDVQVFTEFRNYRRQILDTFHRLMETVHQEHSDGEIYVVAHSEGSVIAYLAMLEALCGHKSGFGDDSGKPLNAPWAASFRGLMTIGSPIGKHQRLWPWLWQHLQGGPGGPQRAASAPIKWRNYYDFGDPVGYSLGSSRKWLSDNGWNNTFTFDAGNRGDIGFTRYAFPGKAHTDYWNDPGVFGHFFSDVVWPKPSSPPTVAGAAPPAAPAGIVDPRPASPAAQRPLSPPKTKPLPWFLSRCVPYLLACAALVVGAYMLVKGTAEVQGIEQSLIDQIRDTLGAGLILAGLTVVVRIPRLTFQPVWVVSAVVLFVVSLLLFPVIISEGQRDRLKFVTGNGDPIIMIWLLTTGIALATFVTTVLRPALGVKLIVFLGSVAVMVLILVGSSLQGAFTKYQDVKRITAAHTGLQGAALDEATAAVGSKIVQENKPIETKTVGLLAGELALKDPRFKDKISPWLRAQAAAGNADASSAADRKSSASAGSGSGSVHGSTEVESSPGTASTQPMAPHESSVPAASIEARLWPFVLAYAAFVYLWWLAALLLDLTVVWHHFIKGEAIVAMLRRS